MCNSSNALIAPWSVSLVGWLVTWPRVWMGDSTTHLFLLLLHFLLLRLQWPLLMTRDATREFGHLAQHKSIHQVSIVRQARESDRESASEWAELIHSCGTHIHTIVRRVCGICLRVLTWNESQRNRRERRDSLSLSLSLRESGRVTLYSLHLKWPFWPMKVQANKLVVNGKCCALLVGLNNPAWF